MLGPPFQLPDSWAPPDVLEDVIVADAVSIHRSGLSTLGADGEEVCASAADVSGPAVSRAWFELLERVSTLEAMRERRGAYDLVDTHGRCVDHWLGSDVFPESAAPTEWRYARSNGVALHVDWATACHRAKCELAERDRVLRAWYGETRPLPIDFDVAETPVARATSYAWRAYSFPAPIETRDDGFSSDIEVVGVFGFPVVRDAPLVLGFAGRAERNAALVAALGEATQQLGFLWGEPIADDAPAATPTAMHHLDVYQVRGHHAVLQRWLEDGHERYGKESIAASSLTGSVGFVDLTPSWIDGGLRVAKAVCRAAVPLIFGPSPLGAHLPPALALHPIP